MSKIIDVEGIPVLVNTRRRLGPQVDRQKKKKSELGIQSLSKRQKKALEIYVERGMTRRKASAIDAEYSSKGGGAAAVIPRIMKRKPIQEALEKKGVTPDRIATVMDEGLSAMHPIKPKQPDHIARHKFVQEANKVLDHYPAKKIQIEEKSIRLHITKEDYLRHKKYYDDD